MKSYINLLFAIAVLLIMACGDTTQQNVEALLESTEVETEVVPDSLLRHVVLFNFVDSANDSMVAVLEDAFAALPGQIDVIKGFEWGTNNSPEGISKGLTHCFLVTFDSEEGRAAYLPHPAHQAFVTLVGPYVEDVTVVDYWTK